MRAGEGEGVRECLSLCSNAIVKIEETCLGFSCEKNMVSPGMKVVPIQFDLAGRDDISIYDLKAAAIQFDFSEGVSRALMFARSHFLTL